MTITLRVAFAMLDKCPPKAHVKKAWSLFWGSKTSPFLQLFIPNSCLEDLNKVTIIMDNHCQSLTRFPAWFASLAAVLLLWLMFIECIFSILSFSTYCALTFEMYLL
jgi:hypothetical protein